MLRPCGIDDLEWKGAATGPEELVRTCLDEMGERNGLAVGGDVAETHRAALLGTTGVAAVLIGYALSVHDSDRDDALELFEALLRAALQDEEGAGRVGARFLHEAARTMRLLVGRISLEAPAAHDLARAYARAGAEAPPELVQRLIELMDELTESGRLPFDPDSEIERMSALLDVDEDHVEHFLHRKLDERIGTLPEELRAAFACGVACRDEAVCGRIAMYWLLDDSAEVRLGAAEGFRERTLKGIVEPVSAALVPSIRNWMPADAGRTLLDAALANRLSWGVEIGIPFGDRFCAVPISRLWKMPQAPGILTRRSTQVDPRSSSSETYASRTCRKSLPGRPGVAAQ